ncbi:MAG: histone deacetylase family protein [Actinomycetes bacterium]
MDVVTSPAHAQHDPAHELSLGRVVAPRWERPARIDVLEAALGDAGHTLAPAVAQDDEALLAVHDPDLVAWLRDGHARWIAAGGPEVCIPDTFPHRAWGTRRPTSPVGEAGWWVMDTATPVVAGSWAAARAAVDVALTALDLATASDGAGVAYGLTRPPGHHAGRGYLGGFCLVNHAAVAAHAARAGGRVAILDVDHHHGNGTQELFWGSEDVLYVSLHADPARSFPWFSGFDDEVGEGPGRGTTRNLPLTPGIPDDAYLDALTMACEAVDDFDPATVVVSLGFDPAATDPVGGLGLSPAAWGPIGRILGALDRPTVLLQEGGYDLGAIGQAAVDVVAGIEAARA